MYCEYCGARNQENAIFCGGCGKPLSSHTTEDVVPDVSRLDPTQTDVYHPESTSRPPGGGIPIIAVIAGGLGVILCMVVLAMMITAFPIRPENQAQNTPISSTIPQGTKQNSLPETSSSTTTHTIMPSLTAVPTSTPVPTSTLVPAGGGSGWIAYADYDSGKPQVFLINIDGSNTQKLTDMSGGACQPDWSPDGSQIVFISPCSEPDHTKTGYPGASLYVMKADGSEQKKLPIVSMGGDFDPAWSPDGRKIVFITIGRVIYDMLPHLAVYDVANERITQLIPSIPARAPSWSPDNKRIVFEMIRGQIWIINSDGSGEDSVFSTLDLHAYTPAWSPNGQMIVFGQQTVPMLVSKTLIERISKEKVFDVVISYRPAWEPDFSPDGGWLLFGDDDTRIYAFPLKGDSYDVIKVASGFHGAWGP